MNERVFLTAEWKELILANYVIAPGVLKPFLPTHTEIDLYNSCCYVSLVGFMFRNVKLKGIRVPFHTDFPEVNLRFYVKYHGAEGWKRGVVFIKEIVPKPAITFIANRFFNEHYATRPMEVVRKQERGELSVAYSWKDEKWNRLAVRAADQVSSFTSGSEEEFITEHYWGYAAAPVNKTNEYHVSHPSWKMYPVLDYKIDCDFGKLYGAAFNFLTVQNPVSVFLAEGSAVKVFGKSIIQ